MFKNKTAIIAITGAESTGKSTLVAALAKHYNVPFVPEFARDYVLQLKRKYTFDDVEFIARKQVEQYRELLNSAHPFVFLDTWLFVTKIWFEVVFKAVPVWLEKTIREMPVDLFLVCATDLPWIADTVRENGGEERNRLQECYINEIKKYNFTFKIVRGEKEKRLHNAIAIVEGFLHPLK